jgi:penicillin-binding protein A
VRADGARLGAPRRLSPISPQAERRRRILTRAVPVCLIGIVAFVLGALLAARSVSEEAARRFVEAWARGDFPAMHEELTKDAAARYPLGRFTTAYQDAERMATVDVIDSEDPESSGGTVTVPVLIRTHAFGEVRGALPLPVADGEIAWEPHLVFPGLSPREELSRRVRVPQRAPILAKDGTPLAEGPAATRSSPVAGATINVAGELGVTKGAEAAELEQLGFPDGALAGTSGLEQAFNTRLAGQPGGELVAESAGQGAGQDRVLAAAQPRKGEPVRTTIDPGLQEATAAALGDAFGGVAVLDARNGSVLALAGIAFSSPQPPGSSFKIVTTTAALETGIVKPSDTFPVESTRIVAGREIANAHDQPCGGTFTESFAHSCNTVFAPLGVDVGNDKLVDMAERYGWNSPPTLYDKQATAITEPGEATIPTNVGTDLDLAVSAIGQGEVLATPLTMASVSQTVAAGGVRSPNPIVTDPGLRAEAKPVKVTSADVAATLRELMVGVVEGGTGTAASLPGIEVAGKTGTAELGPAPVSPDEGGEPQQKQDAWFTAFAPARNPRLAVAVMIANTTEDGGTVAAPVAREVLAAGL